MVLPFLKYALIGIHRYALVGVEIGVARKGQPARPSEQAKQQQQHERDQLQVIYISPNHWEILHVLACEAKSGPPTAGLTIRPAARKRDHK
jgi:hypothetical protein